jgi:diguanylate cyclase (GGDEF)-like protein
MPTPGADQTDSSAGVSRRADASVAAPRRPAWEGSLAPVIAAIVVTLFLGNGALFILLPRLLKAAAGAGLSPADAEAQGRLIALGIVAVSCSLGAVVCLLLNMARRHLGANAAALDAARAAAEQDALTGALNRRHFVARLGTALADAPADASVALYLVDIDGLTHLNEQHGSAGGDAVLAATVTRLGGGAALVGRLGADEFAVATILDDVPDAAEVEALAVLLSRPVAFGATSIAVRAVVGGRVAAVRDVTPDDLLATAELALREAKVGASGAVLYSEALATSVAARRALEARLIAAAAEDGFEVHYQPICHAQDGRLWGFEALVRLPARGDAPAVAPDAFIPIAERLGLIPVIGRFVIRTAIRDAATWPGTATVSINLSALQFSAGGETLTALTRRALDAAGLPAERLVYEIVEGRHLAATPEVLADINALKALGVGLALDDFGTGYSTLAYLWAFPFDKLKLDASFVRAMSTGDSHAHTVLGSAIRLAHALGLAVTVEGIETEAQAQYLRLLGCDLMQGWLYGRPADAAATLALVQRQGDEAAAASAPHAAAG